MSPERESVAGAVIPHSRRAAGAACLGGEFWIYAGFGATGTVAATDVSSGLWRFGGDGWERMGQGPLAARYPSLASGPGEDDGFVMFGGCGSGQAGMTFENRVWRYQSGDWRELTPPTGPAPQGRYTSLLAWRGGRVVMFGGHSQTPAREKTFYGDLWTLDPDARRWDMVHGPERGPGPRYGFGWAVAGSSAFLFGGYDGERDRGDLWTLDLDTLAWTLLADEGLVPDRYCPALGVVQKDAAGKGVVLFGGRSKVRPKLNFSDTWVFGDGAWRSGPGGPGYHAKPAYASDGRNLWLFGGEGPRGHLSDLWRFNGEAWEMMHGCRDDDPILW